MSLDLQFDDFFGGEGGDPFSISFPEPSGLDAIGDFGSFSVETGGAQTSLGQDFGGFLEFDHTQQDMAGNFGKVNPDSVISFSTQQEFDDLFDPPSIAQLIKRNVFDALGIDEETGKLIGAFAKAAGGSNKQRQAQGRGRVGPALPQSARAPTTPAGRTSRARQATSGERAVQAAIAQSNRAQSAARAIANQMARAGTVTTTNDLADMISGATKPTGTKTKLPGTQLRQLAIPRTQMA